VRQAELTCGFIVPEPWFWGPRTVARMPVEAVVPYLNERIPRTR
jgi:5-methyltetrahydrofolate--homocysteine methyltransferase